MQMLFGGLIMAIVATLRGEWTQLTFTWRSGAAELYLIVLGSLVGYSAYVYALKHLPLSTVSLYAYVNPVIAVVLGTWCLASRSVGEWSWRRFSSSRELLSSRYTEAPDIRRAPRRRKRRRDDAPSC